MYQNLRSINLIRVMIRWITNFEYYT